MIRPLAFSLAAGLALLTATANGADETFPVVHNEPITLRILNGQDGRPLAQVHLVLIAGYDQRDIHDQLWREESLTDEQGKARLSSQLANLPWLQVWVDKKPLCQADPRQGSFSVERIRRDGLSTPNRCGTATAEDAPGVFTVFVKDEGAASQPALPGAAAARAPVPTAEAATAPAGAGASPAAPGASAPAPVTAPAPAAAPSPAPAPAPGPRPGPAPAQKGQKWLRALATASGSVWADGPATFA